MSVLARFDEGYFQAYVDVANEFPQVAFWQEHDFASQLSMLAVETTAEFTTFACDDVIYTAHFEPAVIGQLLTEKPELLGVSLRLGQNITEDMFGQPQKYPSMQVTTFIDGTQSPMLFFGAESGELF